MTDDSRFGPFLNASTWGGAFVSGVGALTVTEWLAVGGFILALGGFLVNWWHKRQLVRLARERLDREFPQKKSSGDFFPHGASDLGDDVQLQRQRGHRGHHVVPDADLHDDSVFIRDGSGRGSGQSRGGISDNNSADRSK